MKKLTVVVFVSLLLGMIVQPWLAAAAPEAKLMVDLGEPVKPVKPHSLIGRAATNGVPPLPRSCGTGSVPIDDYSQPVCCVNGYVYFNGQPVAGAQVTISTNGQSVTVTTQTPSDGSEPYFTASLSNAPLNVEPDVVLSDATIVTNFEKITSPYLEIQDFSMAQVDEESFVLFDNEAGETWIWNGLEFIASQSTASPPSQSNSTMIYNEVEGYILWHGGGQTWKWEADSWLLVSDNSPTVGTLAYDSVDNQVLLITNESTFIWANSVWVDLNIAGPNGINSNVAFDRSEDKLMLLTADSKLWVMDGETWQQLFVVNMQDIKDLAYDVMFNKILGISINASRLSTFEWDWETFSWNQQVCCFSENDMPSEGDFYIAQENLLFVGQRNGVSTFEIFDVWNHKPTFPNLPSSTGGKFVFFSPTSQLILFHASAKPMVWDGSSWQNLDSPDAPFGNKVVFDPNEQKILMFDGKGAEDDISGDTWIWDGVNWNQVPTEGILPLNI